MLLLATSAHASNYWVIQDDLGNGALPPCEETAALGDAAKHICLEAHTECIGTDDILESRSELEASIQQVRQNPSTRVAAKYSMAEDASLHLHTGMSAYIQQ